jgi:putative ABC transport system permease protein
MLKNYLTIAWRNITHHKAYALLNISGLAVGLASSILILLWVQNEWSYDKFHQHAAQIYRLTCEVSDAKAAVNSAGMRGGLKAAMPVVTNTTRLYAVPTTVLLETGNKKFEEKRVFYADPSFMELFSFPLLPVTAPRP